MSAHTPTPWKLFIGGKSGHILSIYSKREDDVLHWTGFDSSYSEVEQQQANAEFIVRACNSHAALVKALQKAQELLDRAAGESMGIAMSDAHPNPDKVLLAQAQRHMDFKDGRAALALAGEA